MTMNAPCATCHCLPCICYRPDPVEFTTFTLSQVKTCSSCRWFEREDCFAYEPGVASKGFCKKKAPIRGDDGWGRYPMVWANDKCGDHDG